MSITFYYNIFIVRANILVILLFYHLNVFNNRLISLVGKQSVVHCLARAILCYLVDNLEALYNISERRIAAVKKCRIGITDKELA